MREMILFFGDCHGKFGHVERAVAKFRPQAIILLGDIEAQQPLEKELCNVLGKTEVWFIHGNHDTDNLSSYRHLVETPLAERNLHGRVVEIAGLRIAGLGGIFRGDIWRPQSIDDEQHFASYEEYQAKAEQELHLHDLARRKQSIGKEGAGGASEIAKLENKLFKHRSTIFPDVFFGLAAQAADVLVTHEAPSCHPHGFAVIDELARCMGVKKAFHAHMHDNLDYSSLWPEIGFEAYGVGLRGAKNLQGKLIIPGELDDYRACRQGSVG